MSHHDHDDESVNETRRKVRDSEEEAPPEALLGTEVTEEDDAELAGPAATASFDAPPEPLTGS